MRKLILGAVVSVSAALTACGGSLCDKSADLSEAVLDKGEKCLTAQQRAQFEAQGDKETCEAFLDAASDDVKDQLEKSYDAVKSCVDDLDSCDSAEQSDTFGAAVAACQARGQ